MSPSRARRVSATVRAPARRRRAAAAGALAAVALGAAPGAAQPLGGADLGVPPPPAPPRLDVRVGETVARDVGIAVGYRCDDPALARIELRSVSDRSNAAVVTGLREGATLCRFGTDPYRPSIVYELRVLPRRYASSSDGFFSNRLRAL